MSQEPSQPTAEVFGRSHRSFSFSTSVTVIVVCWFFNMLVALRLQLSEDHIASILLSGSVTISTHFTGIK